MSSGEDDGYFADGLTEEILNSLTRLPELLVTARTSSFHFKDRNLPIPEIAKILGVDHVVEGSVRRAGDRVRITAQLVRADDGFHMWSNTYDRTLEDVFAVQEDIAENIASTLDVVLNEDKRQAMSEARIKDVEAFIAFQKGLEAFEIAHTTSDPGLLLPEANKWFDRALEIAPELTIALYLRTDLYGHVLYKHASGARTYSESSLREAVHETRISLDKAWQSAVNDTQRAILDAERTLLSDNWTGIGRKLDQAYKSVDCTPVNWIDSFAATFGWAEQSTALNRRLLRCDPLDPNPATYLSLWEIWNGKAADAVAIAENSLKIQGFHPRLDDARFYALLASGQYRTDPDILATQPEGSPVLVPRSIFVHALNNDIDTARQVLVDWQAENKVDDMHMLIVEASLGNRQAANEYAAIIDARIGGTLVLTETIRTCMCGAPFDLDVTPNFKIRIEEANLNWPPYSPIQYPAKDW
jgi:TolB-like protein